MTATCKQDDDDTAFLSDHTKAMRLACDYCLNFACNNLEVWKTSINFDYQPQALFSLQQHRQARWDAFGNSISTVAAQDFLLSSDLRQRLHDDNLPCLIQLPNDNPQCQWFQRVNLDWQSTEKLHAWFLRALGPDCQVPLRYSPSTISSSSEEEGNALDTQGRAQECLTQMESMETWVRMLESPERSTVTELDPSSYYLKDWHLLLELSMRSTAQEEPPLYQCPTIFEMDLLNSFLLRFTSGDYRFCYWGPAGSTTPRHSDVLHSFSWSYNAVGTKEWTFYHPQHAPIQLLQQPGQLMFVPSQWQHDVVNQVETVSINHNWITTSNIDSCWNCLETEMEEIRLELGAWGVDSSEADESMLRGCVGLDVTAFFLMVLTRIVDLLSSSTVDNHLLERDLNRLVNIVEIVLDKENSLNLLGRLTAVLASDTRAEKLRLLAVEVVSMIKNEGGS